MLPVLYGYVPELLRLPRLMRRLIVAASDLLICSVAVFVAFWLRIGEWNPLSRPTLIFLAIASVAWIGVAMLSGIYLLIIRFSGRHTVFRLIPVFVVMSVVLGILLFGLEIEGIPRTLSILHPLVFFFGAATSRIVMAQMICVAINGGSTAAPAKRVLIYGAGSAGQQLAQSIRREPGLKLAAFVDCNKALKGRILEGKVIWHSSQLEALLAKERITDVFLAMPSASRREKRTIVDRLQRSTIPLRVRILPSMSQIAFDSVSVSDLRTVQIEELLGRDEVQPSADLLERDIRDKRVLVTGAGGSIGSELSRQILRQRPDTLILADQAEHSLYLLDTELTDLCTRDGLTTKIIARLVDVSDQEDCRRLFASCRPDTVFHAAAYKHVPLVEDNPISGIRNNVFGTLHAALNAERAGVKKFVLVSTDKAVRPTNIMGASKRICELIVQARAEARSETMFTAVRFGNVLGSSGSVVPRFREQIARGGPVTVTHRDVTRYFMTIPEASQLVIQAGALAEGGEVFLLDMGEPVKIVDLAKAMIELSGLSLRGEANEDGDIEIVETGLRPGEKLYEELLIGADSVATEHPRIVKAREQRMAWSHMAAFLTQLNIAVRQSDSDAATRLVRSLVPGHSPSSSGNTDVGSAAGRRSRSYAAVPVALKARLRTRLLTSAVRPICSSVRVG
jgi:FlaA1/EpsC-like NDP-sugar epimerase